MFNNGDALARIRAKIAAKKKEDDIKAQAKLRKHREKEERKARKKARNKRDTRNDK